METNNPYGYSFGFNYQPYGGASSSTHHGVFQNQNQNQNALLNSSSPPLWNDNNSHIDQVPNNMLWQQPQEYSPSTYGTWQQVPMSPLTTGALGSTPAFSPFPADVNNGGVSSSATIVEDNGNSTRIENEAELNSIYDSLGNHLLS